MVGECCVASFYHLVDLENCYDMRPLIRDACIELCIKGTIVVSHEGINGTVSGSRDAVDGFFSFLSTDERLSDLQCCKFSSCASNPFEKLKVRLKSEIVKMGVDGVDIQDGCPDVDSSGWEAIVKDDSIVKIDVRNAYEWKLGSFHNSVLPDTEAFWEFPKWFDNWAESNDCPRDKKIAMFCTGGIRCEKAGAYLKQRGYENVLRLRGGVLQYFLDTRNAQGLWHGDCFVFDNRVAVNAESDPSEDLSCVLCDSKLRSDDLCSVNRGQLYCSDCRRHGSVSAVV